MTLPVVRGYADYERQQPVSDQVIVNDTNTAPAASIVYGPFYVGNLRALRVLFSPTSADGCIQIRSYSDLAGATLLSASQMNSLGGQAIQRTFRPFAPVIDFKVFPSTALTVDYTLFVSTVADTRVPLVTPGTLLQFSREGANVNAGATVTVNFVRSVYGPLWWHCNSNAASWIGRLQTLDQTGTAQTFARAEQGQPIFRGMVLSPGGGLRFTMQNLSGAAALFDSFVVSSADESAG